MIRRREQGVLVNPGSVGLSLRRWWPSTVRIAPWAEYGLLTVGDGKKLSDVQRRFSGAAYLGPGAAR